MHVPPPAPPRAFRKLALLKPGGTTMITLRDGPFEAGSRCNLCRSARSRRLPATAASPWSALSDRPTSAAASTSLDCRLPLRLSDDGSVGLQTIRGVILNEDKSSTYKLGLLPSLAKIDDAPLRS